MGQLIVCYQNPIISIDVKEKIFRLFSAMLDCIIIQHHIHNDNVFHRNLLFSLLKYKLMTYLN